MRLTDLSYRSGRLGYRSWHATEPETSLPGYLEAARKVLARAKADRQEIKDSRFTEGFEALRWFPLPGEVQRELSGEVPAPGRRQSCLWDDVPRGGSGPSPGKPRPPSVR